MYEFRLTQYDFDGRAGEPADITARWTSYGEIGEEFGGHVLIEDEYLEAENKYLYSIEQFAIESDVSVVEVLDLHADPAVTEAQGLSEGAVIPVERALSLVRVMLREDGVDCRLENGDRFFIHVGSEMFVYIGSHVPCERAIAEAERIGLFVDRDYESPYHPDETDEFYWLDDDRPVAHELVAYVPDGESRDRFPIDESKAGQLRTLFNTAGDPNFYRTYKLDQNNRSRVAEILGVRLDPGLDYYIQTYSVK